MSASIRLIALASLAASPLLGCGGSNGTAPPSAVVKAASGASYDLAGTTWTRCEAGNPAPGQSYWHAWAFGQGTATIRHEVHTASTTCTGATDPSEHFEIAMTFAVGPERAAVGWDPAPPTGYAPSVSATGVTFSSQGLSVKGVVHVDDTRTPHWLFVTNPGDAQQNPPPTDADGYPTVLPDLENVKQ
jgi:hypothetical protein